MGAAGWRFLQALPRNAHFARGKPERLRVVSDRGRSISRRPELGTSIGCPRWRHWQGSDGQAFTHKRDWSSMNPVIKYIDLKQKILSRNKNRAGSKESLRIGVIEQATFNP
jgi:hypothetical protein